MLEKVGFLFFFIMDRDNSIFKNSSIYRVKDNWRPSKLHTTVPKKHFQPLFQPSSHSHLFQPSSQNHLGLRLRSLGLGLRWKFKTSVLKLPTSNLGSIQIGPSVAQKENFLQPSLSILKNFKTSVLKIIMFKQTPCSNLRTVRAWGWGFGIGGVEMKVQTSVPIQK